MLAEPDGAVVLRVTRSEHRRRSVVVRSQHIVAKRHWDTGGSTRHRERVQ
jgi:hypothetical protein